MTGQMLRIIWVPLTWVALVGLHIILFAESKPAGLLAQLFEGIILFSCFLMYPIHYFQADGWLIKAGLFGLQFLFWWLMAYWITQSRSK